MTALPKATSPEREMTSSRIPGFYKLGMDVRHRELAERFDLSESEVELLAGTGSDCAAIADKMVENCVGVFRLPIGLGLNFRVNDRDYVVPMVVEEPSVVAAASGIARLVYKTGGFQASADRSVMIAQVQVTDLPDLQAGRAALEKAKATILACANDMHPTMLARGGGAKDLEVRVLDDIDNDDPMLVVHLLVDCQDAMGANVVNTMAEGVTSLIEKICGGRVGLRILSNLADRRLARASCRIPEHLLEREQYSGEEVAIGVVEAYRFAAVDPYRAATHNKGIMNGIDAVALATGNDWRSIEAGAHAYAARNGRYESLTKWWRQDGALCGEIELPMAVGVIGGSTRVHPLSSVLRKILRAETAQELAMVMASVGLAQNLGALRALGTEGIQRGHMSLHARSVAIAAGASEDRVEEVATKLRLIGDFSASAARRVLNEGIAE